MTDFVGRVLRPEKDDWIIRSLMDNDFYKMTMLYFIFTFYRGKRVRFRFINRHKHLIPLAKIIDEAELRAQLDHAMTLRFTRTDIAYLRGQNVYHDNMFSEEYLAFLANYQLPPYTLTRAGDQYEFTTDGPWELVSPWETIFLTIVSELLYRTLMREMRASELDIMYARAKDKLYGKLKRITSHPNIRIADFGYRRRHSHLWHKYVLGMCREVLGRQFVGASSTWMAFNQDLIPIGTNAHELPMVLTALADTDEEKLDAQYEVLRKWAQLFPKGGLRIALPDTYGSEQFWRNMPRDLFEDVVRNWRGDRLDSGDPNVEAEATIQRYLKFGIDPTVEDKILIPSDGWDIDPIIRFHQRFDGRIPHSFGWGTTLTNDFIGCDPCGDDLVTVRGERLSIRRDDAMKGHSFVCKVDLVEGRPAVKLSNNIQKATGPKEEVERYLKIFGHEGRVSQPVLV